MTEVHNTKYPGDYKKGCLGAIECVKDLQLKSKEYKAGWDCYLKACDCAGSIYRFGLTILFGFIARWFY